MNRHTCSLILAVSIGIVGFLMVACDRPAGSSGTGGSGTSNASTNVSGGHSYQYVATTLDWQAAKAAAEAAGGHLVIVNDAAENASVAAIVTAGGGNDIWIGATDEAAVGTWLWVDGSTVGSSGYVNWGINSQTGVPEELPIQNNVGEDMAVMEVSFNGGEWISVDGTRLFPYVIEFDQ